MELFCFAFTSGARHGHPPLMSPDHGTPGNGLLLFFRVDNFDLALQRARSLVHRFEEEPHVNPNTQTREFSLGDPEGGILRHDQLRSPGTDKTRIRSLFPFAHLSKQLQQQEVLNAPVL
jgi:hypothetical protein